MAGWLQIESISLFRSTSPIMAALTAALAALTAACYFWRFESATLTPARFKVRLQPKRRQVTVDKHSILKLARR